MHIFLKKKTHFSMIHRFALLSCAINLIINYELLRIFSFKKKTHFSMIHWFALLACAINLLASPATNVKD